MARRVSPPRITGTVPTGLSPEELKKAGVSEDMVRLSIGLEHIEDLKEDVDQALRAVLGKTLGVPLFQEQAMKIAMVAAEFSEVEARGLRKAMGTFRYA